MRSLISQKLQILIIFLYCWEVSLVYFEMKKFILHSWSQNINISVVYTSYVYKNELHWDIKAGKLFMIPYTGDIKTWKYCSKLSRHNFFFIDTRWLQWLVICHLFINCFKWLWSMAPMKMEPSWTIVQQMQRFGSKASSLHEKDTSFKQNFPLFSSH